MKTSFWEWVHLFLKFRLTCQRNLNLVHVYPEKETIIYVLEWMKTETGQSWQMRGIPKPHLKNNPIFRIISSRAIQNIPEMQGYIY